MERLPAVPCCRLSNAISWLELSHPREGRDSQSFDGQRPDVRKYVEPEIAQVSAPAGFAETLAGSQSQLGRLVQAAAAFHASSLSQACGHISLFWSCIRIWKTGTSCFATVPVLCAGIRDSNLKLGLTLPPKAITENQ